MSDDPVLIAGGGPVGVIAALALAQRGIPVRLFEAEADVNDAPRASTLHPATLEMLAALGLLDDVLAQGLVARTFQFWDRPARRLVAEFDHAILSDDTPFPFVVQCEQHKIARLGLERLKAFPHAEVTFSSPVSAVANFNDRVEATIETKDGTQTHLGSYLIGADGGRSTVRKQLGIAFDGYTFPERFLVLTTPFDFAAQHGVAFRAYFSDPDEWANLFKVAGDDGKGRWRAVFPAQPGQTDDEVLNENATEMRLQKFFPKTGPYEIFHRNIYRVHQRVAASFGNGRVFLAGDSAHVNNPIGGLGLNCGIHDAIQLSRQLSAVMLGERPESDLALYDAIRRPINIEYVQQQTIANKKRLEEKDAAMRAANFETLRRTAAEPVAHRAFLMRTSLLESVRKTQAAA
ncbi:FAD-dependent oxidoreductase [Bradyrhizobium erythrophlei]|jgi:3-(3-hydroxy-phenyl)propionate hydroxylase|uniref:3-(3-hydroxy-phenyl)propionate hydroxylase n=1 Tax=Bradyrhizobium erythrophlei TaxID=1437360 RepID=A0A1M7U1P1_9BRAD|nr:NAD(P)/FAD-dependent oxidoreductase [Bradyrhizobium erythrophlei]SHN76951.1 3-(3-hydroxy-phenyl)propionate hydroxylase [Bradyrhizobium erythrophlei]